MDLPPKFMTRMKQLLQNEYEDYIESFKEPRYYGLRTNTLKIQPNQLEAITDFHLTPIPWCEEGFYYGEEDRPSKHPYYHAGLYYIQEPSAMAPGAILDIQPGDRVLDLCAAPGGKSTQLGAKLQNRGILVSNDISSGRVKGLLKNIELAGITNAIVVNEKPEKLAKRFEGYFDKILVDAPCSGEGMFRKEPDIIKSWEEYGAEYCCSLQQSILASAAQMLRPNGYMLYSTCTFSPEENEGMMENFLDTHPLFEVIPILKKNGFEPGHPEWIEGRKELSGCARLWPHKLQGEGHFLALLHKKDGPNIIHTIPQRTIKSQDLVEFKTFWKETIDREIDGSFEIHGQTLYLLPEGVPDLRGLRIVRSGWSLGDIKTKRFEPSQALAMGMKKEDGKNIVDFSIHDPRVIRYLKGETLDVEEAQGWSLICVDGFPLGWGKAQGTMLKNKYLPGWKWE